MIYGEIIFMNKTYANNAANECAKHFLPFFFMKNKKFGPRKKDVVFIFFKLRVTKFQLRPDAIPSSRVFRHAALIDVIKLLTTIKMK